jgi:hypothetical protein
MWENRSQVIQKFHDQGALVVAVFITDEDQLLVEVVVKID